MMFSGGQMQFVWCTLVAALVTAAAIGGARPFAASTQTTAARTLASDPTVSWTCPMHKDILEDRPGICPICKMALVAVRLDAIWTCPVHAVVAQAKPGKCPIDHTRDLVQVTVAVSWTCRDHPDVDVLEPGTCADGSPMVIKRTPRPHGNHNPQHGGLFFMAPDNWHHIEGVYPAPGVFRVYFYDEFAKPLPPEQLRAVKGRLVLKETFDPATKQTQEQSAFPLAISRDGQYLEARIDAVPVPAQMTAKIQFKPDAREGRFDFAFGELSKEPR
jgi:Heavy metal binding domain